jgi:hypothetical protein
MATRTDLKALAQENSTCLTMFLPLAATGGGDGDNSLHLKRALAAAETKLAKLGLESTPFLQRVEEIGKDCARRDGVAQTAIIYCSANHSSCFGVPDSLPETVLIGESFHVLPLLKTAQSEHEFYVLALSQKHTRLMHCTHTESQEVELPASVPRNLFDFNQHAQPDHRLENRSQGGQQGKPHASHPGVAVAFGTGSDADQKDEYLYHFYNEIDKQLQAFLRTNPLPLVIAGVDYEIALYHRVSEYPALVPDGVHGSPDGLKGPDLHARALKVLKGYTAERINKALAQYEKAGGDRISTTVPEIVKNAFDGRVLYLFLAEGAAHPGRFDQGTREVYEIAGERSSPGSDDLLNAAAIQTIGHAGDVFVLPPDRMPGQCGAAAMLRF